MARSSSGAAGSSEGSSFRADLRWQIARSLQARDTLYPIVARLKPSRSALLTSPDTDLVIEGSPRSANTFLVSSCELLNPDAKLAHHLHAACQIARAHRFEVPCVVLVRDPFDVAASTLVWAPNRKAKQIVADWIRFYEHCLPYADGFVAVSFPLAIRDPGRVLREVNERFGSTFDCAYGTRVTRAEVLARVDERARIVDGAVYETRVARPSSSAERTQKLAVAREHLVEEIPEGVRRRALALDGELNTLVIADGDDRADQGAEEGGGHG